MALNRRMRTKAKLLWREEAQSAARVDGAGWRAPERTFSRINWVNAA
jgi:hypothetical protein